MKNEKESIPYKKVFVILTLILLSLTVILLLMKVGPLLSGIFLFLKNLLLPFFIAIIISYLLHPIVSLLHNRGMPRSLAVLFIYIIFFGSLTIIFINAFPLLIKQIRELGENIPNVFVKIQGWLDSIRHDHNHPIPDSVQDGIDVSLENLEAKVKNGLTNVLSWISSTLGVVFTAILVPFVSFYILKDYKVIEKTVMAFVPKRNRKEIIRLFRDIDDALGNYIRGQLIVCTVIGVLAYIGYLIVGVPYALLLASVVAITNIIPYFGPIIGATPAVLVGLSISWKMGISVLVVNMIIQMLEGNVISPQIVGKSLHIHPLFIILSLLIGGEIAGLVGLILAVPIFATLKVIVQHIGIYYTSRR